MREVNEELLTLVREHGEAGGMKISEVCETGKCGRGGQRRGFGDQ